MRARLAGILALASFLSPLAAQAQSIPVPTPVPTIAPKTTPLPYPAYGPQAPDVELLIPHKGVPPHVSLEQAIAIAVAIAPTFVSERAAYSEIRAAYGEAKQKVFPTISASGAWQSAKSITSEPGCYSSTCPRGPYTIITEDGSYTISQLIFDGGAVITAIKEAKETDIAGRYTLLYQLDTLAYDVANAYYTVLEDKALVDADEQLVREFEVEEDAVRAEIRNGTSALSALAEQEYETAEARGELVTAQGNAISAQASFATMLGFDANAQIVPEPLGPDQYTATPTYAKSLQQAMLLRPDYLSAQHTVMSDQDALRYALLARVPTVTGSYTGETSREVNPVVPPPFGSGAQWTPSETLGLSVSLPIYDQGTLWYNVEAAKYNLQEAQANLAETKLTVESDVRSALAQLYSARATFIEDQKGLSAAQVAMQAAQASYKVGVDTILDLVTAEGNLATAQSTYITALYSVRVAEQNYLYQLGVSDLRL